MVASAEAKLFLLSQRLSERNRKLIGAGGRLKSAGVTLEKICDLLSLFSLYELCDSLKVAVAAASEGNVSYDAVLKLKGDL